MARRKPAAQHAAGLRDALIERERELIEQYAQIGWPTDRLHRLEAHDAVELSDWQIPSDYRVMPLQLGRYRLEVDDTLAFLPHRRFDPRGSDG